MVNKKSRRSLPAIRRHHPSLVTLAHEYIDKLELAPDVLRRSTGMVYGEQAKYMRWEIPSSLDSVELLQITDMQFGHVMCRYDRVVEYRDWVLEKPNRFMLWTGDNVDAGHALSVGSPFDQAGDPQYEVLRFCETWAPARHRIIGYVGGNHERRGIPTFGDLGTLIATILKVPYSAGRQLIDIAYGRHKPFKIHLWHGVGGARTKGTVAQILDRFMGIGDSDLYLMGHLHTPMVIPAWHEVRDQAAQRVVLRKTMGGVGSSFLNTWGTYGEVAGFRAHDVMMPRAILTPDGKWELTLKTFIPWLATAAPALWALGHALASVC